jgi:hypothetical protein
MQNEKTKSSVKELSQSSKWILDLKDNWDNEGSEGYSVETWERAIELLWQISELLEKDSLRDPIPMPKINPANKGSIDLFWDLDDCSVLINIPSREEELATYYGENKKKETISGKFRTVYGVDVENISRWLC